MVIKDHLRQGVCAGPALRFMDWLGNAAWGVRLPYNYWDAAQWKHAREHPNLRIEEEWVALGLYPWWANWLFGAGSTLSHWNLGSMSEVVITNASPSVVCGLPSFPLWQLVFASFTTHLRATTIVESPLIGRRRSSRRKSGVRKLYNLSCQLVIVR